MAQTNVSSCVLSIIASFSGALDVFKNLRQRRPRRRRLKPAGTDDEELPLTRSLKQGPEDIAREYQRSLQAAGDQIAIGDAIAQTSLAEILLRLNTGLVGIINSFLHSDKNSLRLDFRSLTDLSERSRQDTCRTLRQLYRRSMHMRLPPAVTSRDAPYHGSQDHAGHQRKGRSTSKAPKIRGPTLARVTIQGSSRPSQIALVKPAERRQKSASVSNLPKVHSDPSAPTSRSPPPAYRPIALQSRPAAVRSQTMPEVLEPRGKQPTTSSDGPSQQSAREVIHCAGVQSTPHLAQLRVPKPDTIPVSGPRRSRVPTYYSIASNGTKLGEIPLHKWAEQFDFDAMSAMNRDAEIDGWPLTRTDQKKRRFGLLGMFRRRGKAPG